jgi:hypothetical protein
VIGLEYFLHSWHFLGISIEVGIFSIWIFKTNRMKKIW